MSTQRIIFNPRYILRNDIHRIILSTSDDSSLTTFIHPLHAMILSFFDNPLFLEDAINLISTSLSISEDAIKKFVLLLLKNESKKWIGEGKNACHFPEEVLIEETDNYHPRQYHFRDFIIDSKEIDLVSRRFYIPLDAMMMINTLCYTNCIYCYADRNKKFDLKIPLERIFEIIEEAKKLQFKTFDVSGGEFFLYKHWEALLKKMLQCGFSPKSIPTKVPLSIETIKKIAATGYEQIQVSLDSIDPPTLSKMLQVDISYFQSIETMLINLRKYNLKFRVNAIVTSYNCSIYQIDSLIQYLKRYSNFAEISLGIVGYSLYKKDTLNYSNFPLFEDANILFEFLTNKYGNDRQVIISGITMTEDNVNYSSDKFFSKAMCTGNLQQFYILPDGKVTICEELYWHPKFIIGDLMKQSIMEVWNSKEAMELHHLNQSIIQKTSPCSTCDTFIRCREYGGVCWREVIKSYGKENWDYPDPRCQYAPNPINKIYIK